MKKFGLFLLGALTMLGVTSCNDDDGDYPRNTPLITTVCPLEGGDYCFERDNGDRLYPSDKSRVPGYKPDGDQKQRAIIWFSLLDQTIPGYRYNIALYAVNEIYTGTSEVVDNTARLEELGDAKTGYQLTTFNLSREWLTFCALYSCNLNSKHTFTLAGLCFAVRKALLDDVTITQGPQYEAYAADWLAAHPDKGRMDVPPLKVSMKGRRMIMPGRRFCEYQIRAEVEAVRQGQLEQMPITLMYLRFPFEGREPMLLPVYASKMVLKDYEPKAGDEIDAYVWLQGRVIDFDPQAPDAAEDNTQAAPRQ